MLVDSGIFGMVDVTAESVHAYCPFGQYVNAPSRLFCVIILDFHISSVYPCSYRNRPVALRTTLLATYLANHYSLPLSAHLFLPNLANLSISLRCVLSHIAYVICAVCFFSLPLFLLSAWFPMLFSTFFFLLFLLLFFLVIPGHAQGLLLVVYSGTLQAGSRDHMGCKE